jgi:membrane fusion protein, multidrug efflux system
MALSFSTLKPAQKTALVITIALLLYLLAANLFFAAPQNNEERVAVDSTKDLSKLVQTEQLQAQRHPLHIVLNGATEANRIVRLKAQVEGAVSEMLKREGETVKEGEVIMRIDLRDRKARVAQAKALLQQRKVEYEAALSLNRKGVYSDVRFAQSQAEYEEAKALLAAAENDYDNTFIRAPFDGVLEEVSAELGDLVGRGFVINGDDSVATVVDYDPLVAVGQVPQQRRSELQTDQPATIRLFGDELHQGRIRYVGTVTNPDTRTFRVEVELPNPDRSLPVGISAEIRLPAGDAMAYKVSPSILSQDDAGNVGLKIVDENNIVRFHKVTLLEDTPDGFWVGGLPENIRLVTLGQNFVSEGQTLDTAQPDAQTDTP